MRNAEKGDQETEERGRRTRRTKVYGWNRGWMIRRVG